MYTPISKKYAVWSTYISSSSCDLCMNGRRKSPQNPSRPTSAQNVQARQHVTLYHIHRLGSTACLVPVLLRAAKTKQKQGSYVGPRVVYRTFVRSLKIQYAFTSLNSRPPQQNENAKKHKQAPSEAIVVSCHHSIFHARRDPVQARVHHPWRIALRVPNTTELAGDPRGVVRVPGRLARSLLTHMQEKPTGHEG